MVEEIGCSELEGFAQLLKDYMIDEYNLPDIHLNRVTKNNGVTRIGMLIRENGSNIAPNIYLEKFYQEFQEGASLEEIAKQVLKVNREHKCITSFPVSTLKSFDEVKKDIVYRLINRERNIKYLNTVPHEDYQDLAIVFSIVLQETEDGMASVIITNDMIKTWGVDAEQLYRIAHENTGKRFPAILSGIQEVVDQLVSEVGEQGEETSELENIDIPMYIVTNQRKMNGAAVILYENELQKIGDVLKEDYFLLPSSIHEMIVIPVSFGCQAEELALMVHGANQNCVLREEILSDSVYRYYREEGVLKIVAS